MITGITQARILPAMNLVISQIHREIIDIDYQGQSLSTYRKEWSRSQLEYSLNLHRTLLITIFASFYETDPFQFGEIYIEESIQLLQISGGVGRA